LSIIITNRDHFQVWFPSNKTLVPFIHGMHQLVRARNLWAHQGSLTNADGLYILDTIIRVLEPIGTFLSMRSIQHETRLLIEQVQMFYNQIVLQFASNIVKVAEAPFQPAHATYPEQAIPTGSVNFDDMDMDM
jgi:hypothetical protein